MPAPFRERVSAVSSEVAWHPLAAWLAFVFVHLWLGVLALFGPGLPLGDVTLVYRFWMEQALDLGVWVGIDTRWVYPVVALVPMLLAAVAGLEAYAGAWLSMVMILNAVAFGVLRGFGRDRSRARVAWWWLAFLVLLGPIAVGRIDSITLPLAIIAVLILARRPRLAAMLLTIATWIKVWPAAILLAALVALRSRLEVVSTAAITSLVIVAVALLLGSGANVFSFVTEQTGRGLQIEAPISTFWMWQASFGLGGALVYYDRQILTFQVAGVGVEAAAALITPILGIAVVVITLLGIRVVRGGAPYSAVLAPLALALTVALIAINKVGSPQYIAWLAAPVILGIVTSAAGYGHSFRTPAILTLVIAALTQLIYPYLYGLVIAADPAMLLVLTGRNILLFVLLGWAVFAVATARHIEEGD